MKRTYTIAIDSRIPVGDKDIIIEAGEMIIIHSQRNNKTKICPDCGHKYLDATGYCPSCKKKVKKAKKENKIDKDFDQFVALAKSGSDRDSFAKVKGIKGIPFEVSQKFFTTYNPDGRLTPQQAWKAFVNVVQGRKESSIKEALSKDQVKLFLKDLVSVKLIETEGDYDTIERINRAPVFRSMNEVESFLSGIAMPDIGYNKMRTEIVFKDGLLTGFRYDHGKKDPSFTEQLTYYIENNVSLSEAVLTQYKRNYNFKN